MGVKVVTGYIDIPNHPRGTGDYKSLGSDLLKCLEPWETFVFDDERAKPADTWLGRYLHGAANITHSIADNADKNTKAYHSVQHQKFAWLHEAALADKEEANPADVYVWIDYGILHLKNKGVTAAVIERYLEKAQDFTHITMPGCWPRRQDIDPTIPCWRFCGGLIAVPRALVLQFTKLCRSVALQRLQQTLNVEWEVNTLARAELTDMLPFMWYKADHDGTMFTAAP
jgi:hypothetical protein